MSGDLRRRPKEAKGSWMKTVSVLLPVSNSEGLHELVRRGMYPSRSAAIRAAVRDLLKRELWNRPDTDVSVQRGSC